MLELVGDASDILLRLLKSNARFQPAHHACVITGGAVLDFILRVGHGNPQSGRLINACLRSGKLKTGPHEADDRVKPFIQTKGRANCSWAAAIAPLPERIAQYRYPGCAPLILGSGENAAKLRGNAQR